MAKEAYYFSHDSNARNDEKILELRGTFGWAGYGMFWAVVETLRDSDNYSLKVSVAMLQQCLGIDKNEAKKFYDECINIGLFVENNGRFYSESLMKRMEVIDEKRAKRAEAGRKGGNAKAMLKQNPSIALAVKESKVKESKRKERKEKDVSAPPPTSIPLKKPHSFRDSEYFEKEKFSAALDSSPPPYCNANAEFYYDAALNGSDSKGYKYLDWMAAIKNWMRKDIADDKLKTKFSEPKKINASPSKFNKSQQVFDHNADQLRRIMDGSL